LKQVVSPDPSDPKLAHLDGLNLSRAWMLEGILSALPHDDQRRAARQAAADAHRRAGAGSRHRRGITKVDIGLAALQFISQRSEGSKKEETALSP